MKTIISKDLKGKQFLFVMIVMSIFIQTNQLFVEQH